MKKKNLFTNLKDYNNELEKILEKKDFSEKVKNLLLSMLYKIETSYTDYQKTKKVVPEKWEFVEEIINDIELNCKEIEILKPKTTEEVRESEPIIEKTKIKVYQNEIKMLKAIYEISQEEVLINEKYYVATDALKYFFKISNIMNKTEVIRDFDGWTWYRSKNEIEDLQYNLIYQNLLILIGDSTIQEIIDNKEKNTDSIIKISNKLKQNYNKDLAREIVYLFILIITQKYYKENNSKIIEESGKLKKEKEQTVDKGLFLNELSTEKKQKLRKIDKIEQILIDRRALEKEFIKRNKKGEELFSINTLVLILKKEKEKLMKEINEISEMMNPKKFSERENKLNEKIKFLEDVINTKIQENIMEFQKLFIEGLNEKLGKCDTKKEIIDLLYITRYYNFLEIDNEKIISDTQELKVELDSFVSKLIIKAFDLKAINKISKDMSENLKLFKDILKLKIIDLENIEFIINKQDKKYKIRIYDEESLEYEKEIEELKTEGVKIDKKFNVFN